MRGCQRFELEKALHWGTLPKIYGIEVYFFRFRVGVILKCHPLNHNVLMLKELVRWGTSMRIKEVSQLEEEMAADEQGRIHFQKQLDQLLPNAFGPANLQSP